MNSGGKWALVGIGVAGVAIVSVVLASATHQPVACPAVTRVITVEVLISGDAHAVHDVRLCATGGCSRPTAESQGGEGGAGSRTGSDGSRGPDGAGGTGGPGGSSGPSAAGGPSGSSGSPSATPDTGATTGVTTPGIADTSAPFPAKPTGPETPAPAVPSGEKRFAAPQLLAVEPNVPRIWTFGTLGEYPTRVTATAYGADGRRDGSTVATLRWHRFAAGDVCDVSNVTSPVTIRVGS